jgi:hypothetical protein
MRNFFDIMPDLIRIGRIAFRTSKPDIFVRMDYDNKRMVQYEMDGHEKVKEEEFLPTSRDMFIEQWAFLG